MPTFEYAPAPESRAVVDIASTYGLFINGAFVEASGGTPFKTINPATEETLSEISEATSAPPCRIAQLLQITGILFRRSSTKFFGDCPRTLQWLKMVKVL